jgi:hypothetical protein
MENSVNIEKIIGLSLEEAQKFVKNNEVYFLYNDKNISINPVRVVNIDGENLSVDKIYCKSRCNVFVCNGVISKISSTG